MGLIHTYIAEKSTSAKGNKMKTGNALAKSKSYDTQNQDALFDMRVDTITEGMIPYYTKTLKKLPYANAQAIVKFVMALNTEITHPRITESLLLLCSVVYQSITEKITMT
jgi:hypothetical protein